MEEENLDDFFAKKDKSKKKPSKTRITPDDIESMLEKKLNKASKKKKDLENKEPLSVRNIEDDGEWKDYEAGTEVDYSGLRIQKLQKDELDCRESNEDDEVENSGNGPGPWKPISRPTPQAPPQQDEIPTSAPVSSAAKTGKYIPPGARGQTPSSTSRSSGIALTPMKMGSGGQRRKKHAPNVDSVEDFPSLEAANIISEHGNDGTAVEFEKVLGNKRNAEKEISKSANLSLGNKYGTLIEDDL